MSTLWASRAEKCVVAPDLLLPVDSATDCGLVDFTVANDAGDLVLRLGLIIADAIAGGEHLTTAPYNLCACSVCACCL